VKYTLLELTQKVLSSLDGDAVNSISDTVESNQVVEVISRCYDEITTTLDIPEDYRLCSLDGTDPDTPVFMTRPQNIDGIQWLKYDTQTLDDTTANFRLVTYLTPKEFIDLIHSYNTDEDNIESFSTVQDDGSEITFYYRNDESPTYWTSFDDETLVFNSYDSEVETNLQKGKSLAYGRFKKTFTKSDGFIPDLDDNLFPLLLNNAIALAWSEMKQASNGKAEKFIRDHRVSSQKRKYDSPRKTDPLASTPNYGRR
jgi:hypothetical protein